tara:strand:+ start:1315 stop:1899 length:585 start_codon:yes stop_codon:yes gene_type:complete
MAQKTNVRLRNLTTYLNRYMADLEQATKDRITAPRTRTYPSGRVVTSPIDSSGNLKRSISVDTYEETDSIGFTLNVPEYGVNLNEGEQELPSISELQKWLKAKKIRPQNAKGRFMKRKKVAYAIQKSIRSYGSPKAPFIDEALAISEITAVEGLFITNAAKQDLQEQIHDALVSLGYNMKETGSVASFELKTPR